MTEASELKPCPFCGASAHYLHRAVGIKGTMDYDWWHSIQCNSCNAAVGYDDNRYRDKDDAAKAWNTRAPHAALKRCVEALEGVIRIADRKTVEFDAARKTLAELKEIL